MRENAARMEIRTVTHYISLITDFGFLTLTPQRQLYSSIKIVALVTDKSISNAYRLEKMYVLRVLIAAEPVADLCSGSAF